VAKLYLKRYGHRILDNGFEVVPITPGTKFPNFETWRNLPKISHKRVNRWLSNGHARDGVGIRTKFTPFLDIDCPHDEAREAVIKFAEETIGFAPVRVGNAPKIGMPYRAVEPFKKVQSKAFADPEGRKCQVEFLGDGQQFVAYAIHPDTKKPYRWTDDGMNPVEMAWDDLAPCTREQAEAVCQFFNERCVEEGWQRWKSKKRTTGTAVAVRRARDVDDITDGDGTPLGLSTDEVRSWMERLPNDESVEYEDQFEERPDTANYRNVIFAIWHETNGSDEGREIAWDWSEQNTAKHEQEEGRFDKLWRSADPEELDYPVTFRYVIRVVLNIEREAKKELRDNYIESLKDVDDIDELKELVSKIAKTQFDDMDLGQLAAELKRAFTRLRVSLTPAQARKMIAHRPTEDEIPQWVRPWVYIMHTKRFYNTETGLEIEREAFDAAYSRYLDGAQASFFALNSARIKAYWNLMYKPDDDEEFVFEGRLCINTFSDRLMPPMPEKYTRKDRAAIRIFEKHVENILPDEREREIFLSWLAYIVQTKERPNWTTLLQGVEGDGKSFFGEMMGAILGGTRNVRKLDAQQLEDRYTGWAVGQLLAVVEELKLHGHNRYDILNKIKPFITNPSINVHPKNVNPYTALNTTAYLCFTNFRDALPIDDNDRRHYILKSAWQSGEVIRQLERDDPDYFKRLFGTLNRAGALRKYLTDYELHPEFHPKGRAPITKARQEMIDLSKTDAQVAFEDAIAKNTYPQIGPELVVSGALTGHISDATGESLNTRAASTLMIRNGYEKLPFRIRLSSDPTDNLDSIWVKSPSEFPQSDISSQRQGVKKFLKRREAEINHGDV